MLLALFGASSWVQAATCRCRVGDDCRETVLLMLQGNAHTTCQTKEVPVGSGCPAEAQRVQLFQDAHEDLVRQIEQAKCHGLIWLATPCRSNRGDLGLMGAW